MGMASANVNIITMLLLCFLILLFQTPVSSKKESVDDISLQDAERMINDIMKRLSNDQELEKQLHSKTEIGESDENEEAQLSESKVDSNEIVSKNDKCSES